MMKKIKDNREIPYYGKFNDTSIWVVKKNKQRGKTFKYVHIRSAKELQKHIPLAVNSL